MKLTHETKTINAGKFKRLLAEIPDDYDVYISGEAYYTQVNGMYISNLDKYVEISFVDVDDTNSIFINEKGNMEKTFKGTNGRTITVLNEGGNNGF